MAAVAGAVAAVAANAVAAWGLAMHLPLQLCGHGPPIVPLAPQRLQALPPRRPSGLAPGGLPRCLAAAHAEVLRADLAAGGLGQGTRRGVAAPTSSGRAHRHGRCCGRSRRRGCRGRGHLARQEAAADARRRREAAEGGGAGGAATALGADHLHEGPCPEGDLLLLLADEKGPQGLTLPVQRCVLGPELRLRALCAQGALLASRARPRELLPQPRILQLEAQEGRRR
mmetsp:Transcript_69390/g.174883  ORF Transcript_69390/g.174883 Transcript_69390/m.174883 type:complete len:227 (-) Transcript_69390:20-700(-)